MTASLHLRGPGGPLRAHVLWPARTGVPPVAVLFADADDGRELSAALCVRAGLLVLWPAGVQTVEDAATAVEWVADHAAELAGDARRLIVAGAGSGVALASAVAARANENGWPPIARLLLVRSVAEVADVGEWLTRELA